MAAMGRVTRYLRDDAKLRRPNWDSCGSVPITDAALDAADLVVSRWDAVPTNQGGVQLDLHTHGWDIELELDAEGKPCGALFQDAFRHPDV